MSDASIAGSSIPSAAGGSRLSPAAPTTAGPIALGERLSSIDVLRGAAVLGILVMNIQAFAMPAAAYLNPTAYGDLTGVNHVVWWCTHVLGDQKFMTIFSILFGAGLVIMTSRAEARTGRSAALHYRRMAWLLGLGLVHAYLIWYGDILVSYALCGMIVYPLRRLRPGLLIPIAVVMITISSLISFAIGLTMPAWPPEQIEQFRLEVWQPPEETIRAEIAATTGTWWEQWRLRAPASLEFQTFLFLIWTLWRAGGLMIMGMALHKLGVLGGGRTARFYLGMAAIGFGVGLPLEVLGVQLNVADEWDVASSFFLNSQVHYWASLIVSAGWMGLVLLGCAAAPLVMRLLAPVGRMALTNYLAQSLIASLIFYGHGLALFGEVERIGQAAVVAGIWVVEIIWSPLWLSRFRFGPVEWLWRSLTYWQRQPMRCGSGVSRAGE